MGWKEGRQVSVSYVKEEEARYGDLGLFGDNFVDYPKKQNTSEQLINLHPHFIFLINGLLSENRNCWKEGRVEKYKVTVCSH